MVYNKILGIIVLLLIANPSLGVDFSKVKQKTLNIVTTQTRTQNLSNFKQIYAENELRNKVVLSPEYRLKAHIAMIQEDKALYVDNSESNTIYGELLNIIDKLQKLKLDISDLKYAQQAKNLFDLEATFTTETIPTPEEFDKMKIIIPDNDFDKINPDLKDIILFLNTY